MTSPLEHMHVLTRRYPNLARQVDHMLAGRGRDLPGWPGWCFLPMAASYAIASAARGVDVLGIDEVGDVASLAAIGAWRYSQGIYRVAPELLAALIDSDPPAKLPASVFYRLPEWCVYIESPGCTWEGADIAGFWAHLEWDSHTTRTELRLLLNSDDEGLIPLPLHLGAWSVEESVQRFLQEARHQAVAHGCTPPEIEGLDTRIAREVAPLIAILLYICSESPEIADHEAPGEQPTHSAPKRIQGGEMRLFPAQRARVWNVGEQIAQRLAAHANAQDDSEHRQVRAHLRRGHWHGYWVGPRKGDERRFIYHWISSLIAGSQGKEK